MGANTGAESATPTMAEHLVEGTWHKENDAPGTGVLTAYAIFQGDGACVEVDPNIGVGLGV